MFSPIGKYRSSHMPMHWLVISTMAFESALVGCGIAPKLAPSELQPVTIYYEDGAQVEIISPQGVRILVDVADPTLLSRPVTNADILLTTHKHEDHYAPPFAKAFPGQQLNMAEGTLRAGDVSIEGIASSHIGAVSPFPDKASNYLYLIETGGMRIVHFGDIGQNTLTQDQITKLGRIDIAFSQFANYMSNMSIINHKGFNLMDQVNPTVIIPFHFDLATAKYAIRHWSGAFVAEKSVAFSRNTLPKKPVFLIMGTGAASLGKMLDVPALSAAAPAPNAVQP